MRASYFYSSKHLMPFFESYYLTDISPDLISSYKTERRKNNASPATVNRELAMLNKAFNVAIKEWGWLSVNPVSMVCKFKENERVRWLTFEEETILLKSSPEWLHDLVLFAIKTGLRQDELLSLEWSDVNFFLKNVMVKKSKNGRPRTVPLNESALGVLEKKAKGKRITSKIIFFSIAETKFSRHNVRRSFNLATKRAGIEDFRFHDLRHTFATRMVQAGEDIYKIAKLLGHKDIRMTQKYAHHCTESLRKSVDILDQDKFGHNLVTMTNFEVQGIS